MFIFLKKKERKKGYNQTKCILGKLTLIQISVILKHNFFKLLFDAPKVIAENLKYYIGFLVRRLTAVWKR